MNDDFIQAMQDGGKLVQVQKGSVEAVWIEPDEHHVMFRGSSGAIYTLGSNEDREHAEELIYRVFGIGEGPVFAH